MPSMCMAALLAAQLPNVVASVVILVVGLAVLFGLHLLMRRLGETLAPAPGVVRRVLVGAWLLIAVLLGLMVLSTAINALAIEWLQSGFDRSIELLVSSFVAIMFLVVGFWLIAGFRNLSLRARHAVMPERSVLRDALTAIWVFFTANLCFIPVSMSLDLLGVGIEDRAALAPLFLLGGLLAAVCWFATAIRGTKGSS